MDYQHLTKDRSLGYVELQVAALAVEADSEEYPHKPTGKKVEAEQLKFEKGVFKGYMHYEAEFIPALALKDFKFSTGGNYLKQAANGNATQGEGPRNSLDSQREAVYTGVTTRKPIGAKGKDAHAENGSSSDAGHTTDEESDANPSTESPDESEDKVNSRKGVVRSKDELIQHRTSNLSATANHLTVASESGVIVFNITTAQLTSKARLEVLLDDGYWPAFTTPMARSRTITWDHTGEGVIKELDFGRVWLRLNEAEEGTKDDIIAEWKEDAKKFLQEAMVCLVSAIILDGVLTHSAGWYCQANLD